MKKLNNKKVLQMTLNDRVTELEKKFMNLQEYVIDLIKNKKKQIEVENIKIT